jgi:hypothetical protein
LYSLDLPSGIGEEVIEVFPVKDVAISKRSIAAAYRRARIHPLIRKDLVLFDTVSKRINLLSSTERLVEAI